MHEIKYWDKFRISAVIFNLFKTLREFRRSNCGKPKG